MQGTTIGHPRNADECACKIYCSPTMCHWVHRAPISLPSCYAPCLRLLFTQGSGMLRPMKPAGLGWWVSGPSG